MSNDNDFGLSAQEGYDIFGDATAVPESAWFNFEKVGDAISGVLMQEPYDKTGPFGDQKIYVIKRQADGKEFNVALKATTHAMQIRLLKGASVGDVLGFRFKEEVDTGKGHKAKSIEVRHKVMTA